MAPSASSLPGKAEAWQMAKGSPLGHLWRMSMRRRTRVSGSVACSPRARRAVSILVASTLMAAGNLEKCEGTCDVSMGTQTSEMRGSCEAAVASKVMVLDMMGVVLVGNPGILAPRYLVTFHNGNTGNT